MTKPGLKLHLAFDFELEAPDALLQQDHESLCRSLHEALGAMVLQGMPTITSKQLAKAGIRMLGHHHRLDVVNGASAALPRELLIAAAPHLTDEELDELERRARGKVPHGEAERERFLRRQGLALVSDFRLLPCSVLARLTTGAEARLEGKLNLTNGSVLIGERDRQSRLQANQESIVVEVAGARLAAQCVGHTLSGPVIETARADLVAHRDALIDGWQRSGC